MMTIWKRIKKGVSSRLRISAVFIAIVGLVVISVGGYYCEWQWTGLPAKNNVGPKTLWDWLDLLIIPAVLGFGALWFRKGEEDLERNIENQRSQDAAIEAYLDRMSTLLLEKELRDSEPGKPIQDLARTRTITILRRLNTERKNYVIDFLRAAELLGEVKQSDSVTEGNNVIDDKQSKKTVIALLSNSKMDKIDLSGVNLHGVDISKTNLNYANLFKSDLGYANLSKSGLDYANLGKAWIAMTNMSEASLLYANLSKSILEHSNLSKSLLERANLSEASLAYADLSEASLHQVDLSNAYLCGANLRKATLHEANLHGADLQGTDLKWAKLSGVKGLTCSQLRRATNWELCHRNENLACGSTIPPIDYINSIDR